MTSAAEGGVVTIIGAGADIVDVTWSVAQFSAMSADDDDIPVVDIGKVFSMLVINVTSFLSEEDAVCDKLRRCTPATQNAFFVFFVTTIGLLSCSDWIKDI